MPTLNARRHDPITSLWAAHSAINEGNGTSPTATSRLLAEFVRIGKDGLTAEEAADSADLLHIGYWKRVSDLKRDGLITTMKGHRTNFSGRKASVYKISAYGRMMFKQILKNYSGTGTA